ncbi:MAG: hydroxymethylglutaryl-CoA lyase [Phycisphaerales bacterium]
MSTVRITDVSPRDGLQNERGVISTADKITLVDLLCDAGVDEVEVTSFVSPKWVPQLGDGAEVLRGISGDGAMLSVLVPNEKGWATAAALDKDGVVLDKISVFTSATETFARRNINSSIAESIERFRPVVAGAKERGLLVRGYISCIVSCPFEGPVPASAVAEVAAALVETGVDELDLGDTIGAGTPETVEAVLSAVLSRIGEEWLSADTLTLHLHDTFGRAAECVKAALRRGVRSFDGSAAGLGGCPYAGTEGTRAPGNIDTELLVRTVTEAGFATRVDLEALRAAAEFAREIVARSTPAAGSGP